MQQQRLTDGWRVRRRRRKEGHEQGTQSSPLIATTMQQDHLPAAICCDIGSTAVPQQQRRRRWRLCRLLFPLKSVSFLAKIMLFSNASMLCMMVVQALSESQLSASNRNRQTVMTPNNNNFSPDGGYDTILATNTLPNANRFLHQKFQSPPPAVEDRRPSTSAEHRLYESLFKQSLYQKNVRPVQNHLRSIKVRLGVCVMTIDEIIEKDQTMITSGCIKMKWSDEFLQWAPEAFQNLTWLVMPSTEIWLPDIALVNSPDPYTITRKPAFAEVTNTGQVGYYPSGRFSTRCAISLLFFPFDIQKCELRFESWVYPTQWLHIEPWEQNPIDMKDFYRNHQWDLERVSAIPGNISYDGLDFSTMRFIFYFRRRSLYYSVLSIFPGVLMSILQMFSHTLPVEHPARMTLLTSLFVSASVLQSSLASQMPKSSDGISLIQMYLMIFSSNLIISMVVTFVNMHVWFRVPLAEVPNALKMLRSFLLDTGGTTGRQIEKIGVPGVGVPELPSPMFSGHKSPSSETPKSKAVSPVKQGHTPRPRTLEQSPPDSPLISRLQEGRTVPADDEPEHSQMITTYCCGVIRHRTIRSRRNNYGSMTMVRRRNNKGESEGGSKRTADSPVGGGDHSKDTSSSTKNRSHLNKIGQTVNAQLADRKERWLRFSMKVDKAFLYAMVVFNTICPITIFVIVPQFQSYTDSET